MKIAIIGSTAYQEKMNIYSQTLWNRDHDFRMPAFDSHDMDELEMCQYNLANIKWADEVHIFWDQRSMGTIFDLGIAFALDKRIKVIYLEGKTFAGMMKKYEAKGKEASNDTKG